MASKGTIKWYNFRRGMGFVTLESGMDVFVHRSGIASPGVREGRQVTCIVGLDDKGRNVAKNVIAVGVDVDATQRSRPRTRPAKADATTASTNNTASNTNRDSTRTGRRPHRRGGANRGKAGEVATGDARAKSDRSRARADRPSRGPRPAVSCLPLLFFLFLSWFFFFGKKKESIGGKFFQELEFVLKRKKLCGLFVFGGTSDLFQDADIERINKLEHELKLDTYWEGVSIAAKDYAIEIQEPWSHRVLTGEKVRCAAPVPP